MLEHIWSAVCYRAIIDRATNNVSSIDVIEQINLTPGPGEQPPYVSPIQMTVVTAWFVPGTITEQVSYQISIVDPDDRTLSAIEKPFTPLAKGRRKRTSVLFADVPIYREGYHYVHIAWRTAPFSDYAVVAKLLLDIRVRLET